ncbi:acetylornithine deacetylase [uncultured Roseobacter sp.]|uniref:acetylornithine deacetylase n=1 Tax=uncultured Roseobacter sp. TaxID=114847 RepID=UPI0026346940|nr:acetylornithine deacetylase [uncultured Roseobacter sp.]
MTSSLEILDRLIGFETISARSNLDLIAYVEDFLVTRQFRVHRIADLTDDKAGLYAEMGPEGAGGVLLSAHSDVVPVTGQHWTRPPFKLTRDGDLLFGRGTTDMKGFLAEMLVAADTASRRTLTAPLKLLISYDEEIGCVGIARMRDRLTPLLGTPRLAIVGEPTEMQVAIGHKGKRAYRAEITGQAGHSALAPNYVSALQLAVDLVLDLRALQADLKQNGARDAGYDIPYSTVHAGKMTSGTALNIVPERAELVFEIRHLAADDPDLLERRIAKAAAELTAPLAGAGAIALHPLAAYPGLATPATGDATRQVQGWSGGKTCKVAFGTEGGVLAELGIPTVVCGPGSMERQGHKADEHISSAQLAACATLLANALDTLL